jgi:hypothetical protein
MKPNLQSISRIPRILVFPDRCFGEESTYRASLFILALTLFFLFLVGQRMVYGYYQNPYTRLLAVMEAGDRVDKMMAAAPDEARDQVRERITDRLVGNRNPLFGAVVITATGILFILLVLEAWLIYTILAQFFGAQEQRKEGRRPTLYLLFYAFHPLALRKVLEGIVMLLRNPDSAANALTLQAFREASRVTFSLAAFLPASLRGTLPYNLLAFFTDPFLIWCFVVLVLGGRAIYRMPTKSAFAQAGILMVLLSIQNHFLRTAGVQLGILL